MKKKKLPLPDSKFGSENQRENQWLEDETFPFGPFKGLFSSVVMVVFGRVNISQVQLNSPSRYVENSII